MAFPVAFSTLAFPSTPLADVLARGSEWGYQGVELRLVDGALIDPDMDHAERVRVRSLLDASDLEVVALDSSIKLTGPQPGAQIRAMLELAHDWGAPVVRVFGGPLPLGDAARRAALAEAAQVLQDAAPAAERLGVAIGVETHDDFSSSALVAELLVRADAPYIGAVWDSHHPCRVGETPEEVYEHLGSRLLLAQLKDARRSDTSDTGWDLVLLGEGELPLRRMLGVLDAGGYDGWVSVEWEKHWHPEIEEPEVALPQHLALLRSWEAHGWGKGS